MSFINYANREINCKIVYCGPGLSGKTTNITQIYRAANPSFRGKLVTLNTEMDRTLFFDFLPLELGKIAGFNVRFHLYTVPGQVFYEASRRLILKGADGVVFVADSRKDRMDANYEALRDLEENLKLYNINFADLPYALQLNKRDLEDVHDVMFLVKELRIGNEPVFEAVATANRGVPETLRDVAKQVLRRLREEMS
ncbi:MAG TPA: GTPase domain-containing protein [Acidobacteriota bacterium]|nr:GTPase domain-containing protein [Acidobacteriota bacterium]